ncbi:SCO4225 family membrane protein [Streptomyces sp. NPDC048282]|uniref:SCO4225 family membrane protein n=1 Tax=Streptomyces sp. NPDC048282 TaxID=3365528 RepID=UPI0037116C59
MGPGLVRTLIRLTVGNRLSAAYLTLVAVVIAKATVDSLFVQDPDPDFAWLWPPLVTFPAFLPVAALGRTVWDPATMPNWFFITMIVVSALLQSLALGALRRAVRTRHQRMIRSC